MFLSDSPELVDGANTTVEDRVVLDMAKIE